MMLASVIKRLLQHHSNDLGIKSNRIYSYSIDPNVRANDTHDLVVLITELDDSPQDYGSNSSIDRQGNIQIQIFIPRNYTKDTSVLRYKVNKILENNDWYCVMDTAIKKDPTVDLLVNTTHYRKVHSN